MTRQTVDSDNLYGQVIVTAAQIGFFDDRPRHPLQVCRRRVAHVANDLGAGEFDNTVGCENENIADVHWQRAVIDFNRRFDAQGATQAALFARHPDTMLFGKLFERVPAQSIDPRIADVKDMCGGGLDDKGAQCAHVAPVLVVAKLAPARLRVQPGVSRVQHALCRCLDGPGFRRAIVVHKKSGDRRLAGDTADIAAANPVGQSNANPF